MLVRLIVFAVMATLSHWLFGWDVVWGQQPDTLASVFETLGQEDVGFEGNKFGFLIRVKRNLFGMMRELPPPLGDPKINSTPLSWICLGLTFWLPLAVSGRDDNDS